MERDALAVLSLQLMVHVPKHHKISCTGLLHAIKGDGQIPVPPVDMRLFPVTAAGAVWRGSQPGGTGMSQHHQRPVIRSLPCSINNPVSRLGFRDGSENRLHGLREVKTSSCTAGPGTDHRQLRLTPCAQSPRTVTFPQQRNLLLKQAAASVASTVMISKQDGHRQCQLRNALHQAQISITEIAHKQKCIRLQPFNQFCISVPPVPMEVSGNGKTECCQQNDF